MCDMLKNHRPPHYWMFIKKMVEASNGILHTCPYLAGPFRLNNFTTQHLEADNEYPFPRGDYRDIHVWFNDEDQNIYTLTIWFSLIKGDGTDGI